MASSLVTVVQIAGVTTAAFLSGAIASVSWMTIPSLAVAPDEIAVKQWRRAFGIGKATAPALALPSALCFAYLAYATRNIVSKTSVLGIRSPTVLYGVAAMAILCIVPYTLIVMEPGANRRLMALAEEADAVAKGESRELMGKEGEVKVLLRKWTGMNYNRALFTGFGAVVGAVATMMM
ncbi:hypothetical protein LTR86_001981 [Recurvomyces mirabilis]|nr:hypothetical protein LTR86_001981 [Recurvomyces mirabilis]